MHTVSTRKPTPREQKVITTQMKAAYDSYGCLIVMFLGPAFGLGWIAHWLASFVSENVADYAQWAVWIVLLVVGVKFAVWFRQFDRKQRKLALLDHEAGLVQEIHVTGARPIKLRQMVTLAPIWRSILVTSKSCICKANGFMKAKSMGPNPQSMMKT